MKHEANLQFAIGLKLHELGLPFELEWTSPVGRHDIAIKTDTHLYGIIECKQKEPSSDSFQLARYKSMGVPVEVATWKTNLTKLTYKAMWWTETPKLIDEIVSCPRLLKKWRAPRGSKNTLFFADSDLNLR